MRADIEQLQKFQALLPDSLPTAFEFRHDSWLDADVDRALQARGHARVVSTMGRHRPNRFAKTGSSTCAWVPPTTRMLVSTSGMPWSSQVAQKTHSYSSNTKMTALVQRWRYAPQRWRTGPSCRVKARRWRPRWRSASRPGSPQAKRLPARVNQRVRNRREPLGARLPMRKQRRQANLKPRDTVVTDAHGCASAQRAEISHDGLLTFWR